MSKIKSNLKKGLSVSFSNSPTRAQGYDAFRGYVTHLKKNRKEARALLVNAGIYTETGKLTKAFGG